MRVRISRTIVIEGEEDWAYSVLLNSLIPDTDVVYQMPQGEVRCIARSDIKLAEPAQPSKEPGGQS